MSLVFKTPISTLNTTTRSGQNIGSGECPPCPECPECPEVDLTTGTAEYTANGDYTLTPEGDGFSSVEITVSVPSDVNNQNKTVSPSTSSQTVSADSGYSGLGTVTVDAVTSSIDNNITAGNIKKDVAILGVTGTYDPEPTLQDKTVTPTTSQQVISADNGYDGLDEVTVSAVTSAIDQNIVAGNIKSGVSILGVQGTVQEGITPTGNINITNTSSTDVTNYATAQVVDANLVAGNIKNGVSILGINGSYDPQPNLETGYAYTAETIGTQILEPSSGYDGMDAVELTVDVNPLGCFYNPFNCVVQSNIEMIDELDFQEGFALMLVNRGEIDPRTGYYVANDENGNIFRIMPFMDNPDFDPEAEEDPVLNPSHRFPDNFDLVDDEIVVNFDKSNATVTVDDSDPEDVVYTVEIDECSLKSINSNSNFDTFLLRSINTSSNELSLSTNNTKQFSITCSEPWEIEVDEPNRNTKNIATKSGLKAVPTSTLEIDQTEGDPGTYTLNVLSTTDQNTGFTVRGLNSGYEQHIDVSSVGNYFTITSLEDGNEVTWTSNLGIDIWFSTDEGETWESTESRSATVTHTWNLDEGETIIFKNDIDRYATSISSTDSFFSSTKTVNVSGDIRSLVNSTNYTNSEYKAPLVFANIFRYLKVVDAGDLYLPETVSPQCYYGLFAGCSTLTQAPVLPALSLAEGCYGYMFVNCSSLVEPPELPAKVLAIQCYNQMFQGCTGLETAPELPAIYLATGCYSNMFSGCSSLETAPELPSTTLAPTCYDGMFASCTGLTETPVLPATNLVNLCYRNMFKDCSNLETVTCLATSRTNNSTTTWLSGVAAEGTFYKDPNMSSWPADSDSGIPTGWTVENYGL